MPIKVQTDYREYPDVIKLHLIERIRDRRFLPAMAHELADWRQRVPPRPICKGPLQDGT